MQEQGQEDGNCSWVPSPLQQLFPAGLLSPESLSPRPLQCGRQQGGTLSLFMLAAAGWPQRLGNPQKTTMWTRLLLKGRGVTGAREGKAGLQRREISL